MKTRLKSASAQLLEIKHKKIEKKKANVNSNEVIFAMNALIKSDGGSLLEVKNEHCNNLAKRFRVSSDNIRSIVNKTQPRVKLTRMYVILFLNLVHCNYIISNTLLYFSKIESITDTKSDDNPNNSFESKNDLSLGNIGNQSSSQSEWYFFYICLVFILAK